MQVAGLPLAVRLLYRGLQGSRSALRVFSLAFTPLRVGLCYFATRYAALHAVLQFSVIAIAGLRRRSAETQARFFRH